MRDPQKPIIGIGSAITLRKPDIAGSVVDISVEGIVVKTKSGTLHKISRADVERIFTW